jgi:hypothetical protein
MLAPHAEAVGRSEPIGDDLRAHPCPPTPRETLVSPGSHRAASGPEGQTRPARLRCIDDLTGILEFLKDVQSNARDVIFVVLMR